MKKMTCRQMGGMCDAEIMSASKDEMMTNGMKHVEEAHPEMAAQIKAMPKDDPKMVEWQKKFDETWDNTPDSE